MLDTVQLGINKRLWMETKLKEWREGNLVCAEGSRPRPPGQISELARIQGWLTEPEVIYMTTIAIPGAYHDGGVVNMMHLDLAGQCATLGIAGQPSHRESTIEEIAAFKKADEDRLEQRKSWARNQSYKADAEWGKKS